MEGYILQGDSSQGDTFCVARKCLFKNFTVMQYFLEEGASYKETPYLLQEDTS